MDTRNTYKPPLRPPNLIQHQQPFIHSYNQQFFRSHNQQFNNNFQPSFTSFTEYLFLYKSINLFVSSDSPIQYHAQLIQLNHLDQDADDY